ncbi:MAG: hypothetical protein AAB373_04010 [Patescibacteria group bacterium]
MEFSNSDFGDEMPEILRDNLDSVEGGLRSTFLSQQLLDDLTSLESNLALTERDLERLESAGCDDMARETLLINYADLMQTTHLAWGFAPVEVVARVSQVGANNPRLAFIFAKANSLRQRFLFQFKTFRQSDIGFQTWVLRQTRSITNSANRNIARHQ